MADTDIVIVSAGVVSPIGLSLPETAAAARARVARIREIEWLDNRRQPFLVGKVPDEGLPKLAAALSDLPLQPRAARMLRLAHAAIEEALAPLHGRPVEPIPLLLGLPELHTGLPLSPREFVAQLDLQLPGAIDVARSVAAPRGRAGALMGLREAASRLRQGNLPYVLVGGVDSLVDPYLLSTLDGEKRIRNDVNSDGFSPSEGAAFLLLARPSMAAEHEIEPLASLLGSAQGKEPGHLYSDEKYLGEGLASTFTSLLGETQLPSPIGSVYCSFNGERYWAREFGVARVRHADAFDAAHQMEHPAECFGDMGAAHGPALLALGAHGMRHGYRKSPCLVYASSDHGDRAATLLARH